MIEPEKKTGEYIPVPLNLAAAEKILIDGALRRTHGDVLAAATVLGIGKTTLYRKIKEDPELMPAPETANGQP